jgi:hypothetical protein
MPSTRASRKEDFAMLETLSQHAVSFRVRCNAHREDNAHRKIRMTIEDYLRNRRRLGEALEFAYPTALRECLASDELWEIQLTLLDGSKLHVAGPSLTSCISGINARLADQPSLAA